MSTPRRNAALAILVLVIAAVSSRGQDLTASKGTAPPPPELAEPVRACMAEASTTVMRGADTLEFWWVKAVPLDPAWSGAAAWGGVPEGSLVGAVRIAQPFTDIRGSRIKPGVYTLRYAMQPQDGDHTGVSPFREFLLVAPADLDTAPEPTGHKGAVSLAKKTLGKSHPATLSLDPPATTDAPGAVVTNEAGHEAVVFSVPAPSSGTPKGGLTFGLILVGKIEHQTGG